MSDAAKMLRRAVEVYHFADAIGFEPGAVANLRGRALAWACIIIAAGLE